MILHHNYPSFMCFVNAPIGKIFKNFSFFFGTPCRLCAPAKIVHNGFPHLLILGTTDTVNNNRFSSFHVNYAPAFMYTSTRHKKVNTPPSHLHIYIYSNEVACTNYHSNEYL